MYTITLNGNSSELSCNIFPSLEVDKTAQLCLLSLQTNNSIPNIEPGCNTIGFRSFFGANENITIPTGSYELNELETVINQLIPDYETTFQLKASSKTLKCTMTCNKDIDFTVKDSISQLLGFENRVYTAGEHESSKIVNIMKVNCIKIECNLISGSFNDGMPSQTIHEFFPSVPPGYKILEVPRHLVFYSLNSTSISKVDIVLKDQNDNLINLREQPITIRLQIKHNYGS
jgi:hypothetical protein